MKDSPSDREIIDPFPLFDDFEKMFPAVDKALLRLMWLHLYQETFETDDPMRSLMLLMQHGNKKALLTSSRFAQWSKAPPYSLQQYLQKEGK